MTEGAQGDRREVSRDARSRRRLSSSPRLVSLLVFVFVILGWESAIHAFAVPRIILPAPSAIAISLWNSLLTPSFYYHIGVTLYEAMAGFLLGGGSGFLLGVMIGQYWFAEQTLYP
jgi:NitT/TauT family transport system permease protein